MHRWFGAVVVGVVSVVGLLLVGSAASASAGAAQSARVPDSSARAATGQRFFWTWDDGSRTNARTFAESRYGDSDHLPRLVVTAIPASPRRTVRLEFWSQGRWVLENEATTDAAGIARIALNPLCARDAWCDRAFDYRLDVAGESARLIVTYDRR